MTNVTIINNDLATVESGLRIDNPYMLVFYPNKPKPLSGGKMYFGIPSTDPTDPAYQKRVYIVNEDSSITPIEQPVLLGLGGVPVYNGSPVQLAVDGEYAWEAHDRNDEQVYYSAITSHPNLQKLGSATIIEESVTLSGGETFVTFPNADVQLSSILISGTGVDRGVLIKEDDYTVADGASGTIYLTGSYPQGTKLTARQNAFTSQEEASESSYPYAYDTIAEAKAEDLPLGAKVVICGASSYNDGLSYPAYIVVAGGTGTNDGVDFINMDNGNQLESLGSRLKISTFTETAATPALTSNVLTIDVNQGTVQSVTLNQSVTSIAFANIRTGRATTITLFIAQNGTGGYGVSFSGMRAAGGTAPTIASGANEESVVVLSTKDGSTWYVFPAGDDFQVIP